jgi:hypothetical protein
MLEKLNCYVARLSVFLITVALIAGMVGCDLFSPSRNLEIQTWYDLDAVRNNLRGHHILMNDLDSTTSGYEELASPTANQGKGWQPIGTDPNSFTGSFDGQGYEIRDLFINRPDEDFVGLFGIVDEGGVIEDIGVVNVTVTGNSSVGGLMGGNGGTVSNSYSSGNVNGGSAQVGGLVGLNAGTVSNSYSSDIVTGEGHVGGLVGGNAGTVSNSYSSGNVNGYYGVGGLVGVNVGTMSNSYSTGNVTGYQWVGGLVGGNGATVSNSYSTGSVTGNQWVGGLVGDNEGEGTVSNSFWDMQTSGQVTSDGGTGVSTSQMKSISTFLAAGWNIIAVGSLGDRDPSYIWNIVNVNGVTYPFLSWQP